MNNKCAVFVAGLFLCILYGFKFFSPQGKITETPEYLIYTPSKLSQGVLYPLVIAFSPGADAQQMIQVWQNVADERKWLILASRKFRNGVDPSPVFEQLYTDIIQGRLDLPVDRKRVLATGLSGGGMGSHMFAFANPDLVSAVVINTGMMDAEYYYPKKKDYPQNKIAVFLASPTDFRYNEMKRDRIFLEELGWKTKWIEFQGGHVLAPQSVYSEAAEWLARQWMGAGL